jgi:hypothetical protein
VNLLDYRLIASYLNTDKNYIAVFSRANVTQRSQIIGNVRGDLVTKRGVRMCNTNYGTIMRLHPLDRNLYALQQEIRNNPRKKESNSPSPMGSNMQREKSVS